MIESGYDSVCDEVWYVHSPEDIRRERLKKNRGYTDEKIDAIFASQSKEEAFFKKFKKVIYNSDDLEAIKKQIDILLNEKE